MLLFESLEVGLQTRHRYHFELEGHVESEYSEGSVSKM